MTQHMRWALLTLVALASFSLNGIAQSSKDGIVYLKNKAKIPFSLQSGSKVIKAGEYLLTIRGEGGRPVLFMQSDKGELLLRDVGEYDKVPEKERTSERGVLKMTPTTDSHSPDERWIVVTLDYRNKMGNYTRIRFKIREAKEGQS